MVGGSLLDPSTIISTTSIITLMANDLTTQVSDQQVLGLLVDKIGSANWNQWQAQRFQYYDFVRVTDTGALTTPLNFFSNALGSTDPVSATAKTLEQTNLVKPNTFGQVYFVIQQLRTVLRPLVKARQNATVAATTTFSLDQLTFATRLRQAFSTGVLNFVIGQKAYFDINQPWRTCPPGFGIGTETLVVPFDRTASSTGNAYVAQSNNLSDIYTMSPPQLIEPEQTFQATIDFPDLGYNFSAAFAANAQNARVEAGIILDGYLFRPVQ